MLTLIPEISSFGSCLAPCRHLVSHPSGKMCHGDCLQTATASRVLKFTAPGTGPESPQSKETAAALCIQRTERFGEAEREEKQMQVPLWTWNLYSVSQISASELTPHWFHWWTVSGCFKCTQTLRWQHHLNIPELTLNKTAETLTSTHMRYEEATGLHTPGRSEHLRQLSCTHTSSGTSASMQTNPSTTVCSSSDLLRDSHQVQKLISTCSRCTQHGTKLLNTCTSTGSSEKFPATVPYPFSRRVNTQVGFGRFCVFCKTRQNVVILACSSGSTSKKAKFSADRLRHLSFTGIP